VGLKTHPQPNFKMLAKFKFFGTKGANSVLGRQIWFNPKMPAKLEICSTKEASSVLVLPIYTLKILYNLRFVKIPDDMKKYLRN
jgi:hypothetical protein